MSEPGALISRRQFVNGAVAVGAAASGGLLLGYTAAAGVFNGAAQSEVREKVRLSGRFLTSLRPDSYRDSWGLFLLVTFSGACPDVSIGGQAKEK